MFLELCNSDYWIFFLLFRCFSHFTAGDSCLFPNYQGGLLIVFNHLFLPWISHYPSAECQFNLAIVSQLHCLCGIVLTIFSIAWIITPARTFPHQGIFLGWLWSYLYGLHCAQGLSGPHVLLRTVGVVSKSIPEPISLLLFSGSLWPYLSYVRFCKKQLPKLDLLGKMGKVPEGAETAVKPGCRSSPSGGEGRKKSLDKKSLRLQCSYKTVLTELMGRFWAEVAL